MKKSLGFTIIELLVSITIIGLITSIGATGFQAITRNGRDALRKTDLEKLRSALEIYKSDYGIYPPASLPCMADLTQGYINPYPVDPKSGELRYCYVRGGTNLTYELCAHLENGDTTDLCGGVQSCVINCNYQVVNP